MAEILIECNEGILGKLGHLELKMLVKGKETNTVELKLAAPRAVVMTERLCGMTNAQGHYYSSASPYPKSLLSYPIVNCRF
jgi:hypothetical protein